jgi:hypothetical protein
MKYQLFFSELIPNHWIILVDGQYYRINACHYAWDTRKPLANPLKIKLQVPPSWAHKGLGLHNHGERI